MYYKFLLRFLILCFVLNLGFNEIELEEQRMIDLLSSKHASLMVNNLHIQSHDANTSSEMVTSNVKEPVVPEPMVASTYTEVTSVDTSSVSLSADTVFDQSTQSTTFTSHLKVAQKILINKATSSVNA